MEITRKNLINAAKELKEAGILEIKNPNFIKTEELQERLIALEIDLNEVSEETKAVLESLRTPDAEEATPSVEEETEATENEEKADNATGEEQAEEEPVYQDEPIPAKEEPEQPAEDLKSREALNAAALDMNEVMGLEPGIDVNLDDELFMKAFTKAASMATGTDNFTDHTWAVLESNKLGPERVLPKEVKKADLNKKAAGEKKQNAEKSGAVKEKGTGVIASIKTFLNARFAQEDKTFTRQEILDELTKTITDRDPAAMMNTIKVQVPGRLAKEAGYGFQKQDGGKYLITAIPE